MKGQKGFTLMLVSVGIVLLSIAAASSINIISAKKQLDRNKITINKISKINDALIKFTATYGRLPCPASPTDTFGSATYGFESRDGSYNCNAAGLVIPTNSTFYSGVAPTATLGLSSDDMIDGWGNKIEYVITQYLHTTIYENSINNYMSADGSLEIVDPNSNVVDSNVAYILISRGANGYAAYNAYSSNRNSYPHATLPIEQNNVECNAGSCGSGNLDNIYQISNNSTASDDIMVYEGFTSFVNKCFTVTNNNPNCLNNQCVDSAVPIKWTNPVRSFDGKNEVLVISSKITLPTLDLTSIAKKMNTGNFTISFTISSLATNNSTIYLNYTYQTTPSSGNNTTTLATFSTSQYDTGATYVSSSIGSTATLSFGGSNHLPQNLYFSINKLITGPGSTFVANMQISNIKISNANANRNGSLYFQTWKSLSSNGTDYRTYPTNTYQGLSTAFADTKYATSSADTKATLSSSQGPTNINANTISTISGYLTPPSSGQYNIYIASDNDSTIWMGLAPTYSGSMTRLAYVYWGDYNVPAFSYNPPSQNNWTALSSQQSTSVTLTGGQSYPIFVAHRKNTNSNGHVEFAWSGPAPIGSSPTIISSTYLSTAPQNIISSPPTCKAFYTTTGTLTPASNPQPVDLISLNNTYGRYVKLSLLSSQPTNSGQDSRQDVYYLSEVKFLTTAGTIINPSIYMTSSNLYVDNTIQNSSSTYLGSMPYQGGGLTDSVITGTPYPSFPSTGDFITNGQNLGTVWVTQNTKSPQYVIFDLGATTQLQSILIWNGNQLFDNGGVTCCPGRSVQNVQASVSDDVNYLIYHAN